MIENVLIRTEPGVEQLCGGQDAGGARAQTAALRVGVAARDGRPRLSAINGPLGSRTRPEALDLEDRQAFGAR